VTRWRLAPLLAALMLTGCFYSESELIGFWSANRPLQPGYYTHTPAHPDGTEWDSPTWEGRISLRRGRYVSGDENFPHDQTRLRRLHEDIYIAQLRRPDGAGYGVMFVYENGDVASYHQPSCADLSAAAREEAGVALDPEGFCTVTSLDQLETVMRAYLDTLGGDVRIDGVYRRTGDRETRR